MNIKTLLSPLNVDELYFTNKNTVVIDVLRATTTICEALNNGAKEIVPVSSIEFAMKVNGDTFSGHTLLGGERNTKRIEGFTLGNSPVEYSKEAVEGKTIVLFTTNGSKAIVKAKYSSKLYISSFLNIKSVAERVEEFEELIILCAGNNGLFSYEDSACAGSLIAELLLAKNNVELDDASKMSNYVYEKSKDNLYDMLVETEHGKKLLENNYKGDFEFAAQENIYNILPAYENGYVRLEK